MVRGGIFSSDMIKSGSNIHFTNQGDHPGNSSDKDVHCKHTKDMGTQKYLRESCYHHIEYTAATFLAAFILRRLLNNAALATTTHRKPESVFDETSTQVRVRIINKWRVKMIQMRIYKVKDSSWRKDRKKEKENIVVVQIVYVFNCNQYI